MSEYSSKRRYQRLVISAENAAELATWGTFDADDPMQVGKIVVRDIDTQLVESILMPVEFEAAYDLVQVV